MARDDPDGDQMEILADEVFDGMDVDRIKIAARWRLLSVMMFVDQRVQSAVVKDAVEPHVEEVIEDEEGDIGSDGVEESQLVRVPFNRWDGIGDLDDVIDKGYSEHLIDKDEE
jgi:hypothetical protein